MVFTKKFSEFATAALNDGAQKVVGLEAGVNIQSTRFLTWTTATRPATPFNGLLGYNTDLEQYEYYDSVAADWFQLEDSGDVSHILQLLASHLPGEGASLVGLQNQSGVTNKTVQDLANAQFIVNVNNGSLQNAQALGSLTTGIVKNTTVTGVLSISASLTSIDGLTTVANNLLYTTAPNTYAVIAPANNSALVTDGSGVPSLSQTLPTAVQSNITQLGAQSQALNMNTHLINNVVDPVSPQDAATKNYVDQNALNGTSVYAASAASLGTVTQAGSGIGATLTNAGAQATFALDGVNPPLGSSVLIKDTATGMTAANEGIYTVTDVGSGSSNWVLTRSVNYDTPAQINDTGLIVVRNGSTLAGTAWYNAATIITVDTTPFSYSQFGTTVSITASTGLTATPNPITGTGTIEVDGLLASIFTNDIAGAENLIFGGNFDTNPWQRGTSFTGITPAFNAYTADRFRFLMTSTSAVVTVQQTADAPSVASSGIFSTYCWDCQVTTADNAVAATDIVTQSYRMEGYDWAQLAQRPFVLSFWVKAAKTGIHSVSFQNSGGDRTYIAEYTINAANTWEFKSIAVPASPSAGTWNYTTGIGLNIQWVLMAGSNFFDTTGSWITSTSSSRASANQVNEMDTIGNHFKIQLVKIEPGTVATPWMIRSFEEEFALCSRYFTVLSGASGATGATLGNGAVYSTSQAIVSGFFAVKMRTAPTLTASGTDAVQLATSALVYADSSAVSAWFTNVESFQLNVTRTGSGLSAGNCTAANVKSTGTPGYLQFNAEL